MEFSRGAAAPRMRGYGGDRILGKRTARLKAIRGGASTLCRGVMVISNNDLPPSRGIGRGFQKSRRCFYPV
jgi:hypothetical protein